MVRTVLVNDPDATPVQSYELYPGLYVSATDPGATGAGSVWKDISLGALGVAVWWERGLDDTGWTAFAAIAATAIPGMDADAGRTATATGAGSSDASATATSEDDFAHANSTATATGTGNAAAISYVTAAGSGGAEAGLSANVVDGSAAAGLYAEATGTGAANVAAYAETTTGLAVAGSLAVAYGGTAGISVEADNTSARMAFNGTTPIVPPVLPAAGGITAQDIAAALVALGLVTQTP